MIYGYIRVSTITQNIDRQMDELEKYDLKKEQIFIDKQSGKDFNRIAYQKIKVTTTTERPTSKIRGAIFLKN